jgi:hypothetical protein
MEKKIHQTNYQLITKIKNHISTQRVIFSFILQTLSHQAQIVQGTHQGMQMLRQEIYYHLNRKISQAEKSFLTVFSQ